jgi:hypothetical protein
VGDGVRQISQNRVVLQQVREGLRVRDVVHCHELNVLVVNRSPDDIPADTAEAVDTYLDGHAASGESCIPVRRSVRKSDTYGTEKVMGYPKKCQ